jgi:hypothetical protein
MPSLRHLSAAGCVAFFALSAGHAAIAQAAGPAMTTDEIRVCLCQEQAMEQKRNEVDTQGGLLDERQQELDSLSAEIKRQAVTLSGSDLVGQQVLQDLIQQQTALRNMIQLQIRPAYNRSVADLRQIIEAYNAECTARPRYALDAQQAAANLVCPAP